MWSRDRDSDGGISVLLDSDVAGTADRPSEPPPTATGSTLDFAPIIPALREREAELARIDGLLADARAGEGRLLCIEGPGGIGKTALLAAARARASAAGLTPLAARGAEVEREFPYGVVRQLFEPALAALAPRERDEVLGGAAALASTVLTTPATPGVARDDFATPHGLYWTCANLAARRPLALLVDDAHWADEPSLRFLEFLERRMGGLPVLLVAVVRPGEEPSARLAATPGASVIRPSPLSRAAVTDLVGLGLGPPEPAFAEACRRVTGGNPFLLQELVRSLAEAGIAPTAAHAQRAQLAGPEALGRNLLARLERLGDEAAALARGLAVMGDGAELRDAAAVAELDAAAATGAAQALVAAGLVADGRPLRFVHPIVRAAIYEATPAGARAAAHRRTVAALAQAGAPPERLAAHLLQTEPGADPATVATLREAARRAIAQGVPDAAIAALKRALRERLADDDRVELLATLGPAESGAHHGDAIADLREAHRLAKSPRRRAEITHELVLASDPEQSRETVRLVDEALAALEADDALAARLRADRLALILGSPTLEAADAAWVDSIALPTSVATPADSLTLVMLARHRMMCGRPVEDVVPLVELAVADWRMVEELAGEELWLVHAAVILVTADRLDAARALLARLLETARRRGVVRLFTLASTFGSFVALYSGDVPGAEADARAVLAVDGIERWRRAEAHAPLVEALVERGRADEAEAALETAGMAGALPEARVFTPLLLARGRLRVAAGRHQEGLDDLERAARRLDRSGRLHPAGLDGRASTVLALLALGRRDAARAAARDALERSRHWGTPRAVGRALRMEALAEGGPATVPRLEAAVAELERSPAPLELAAALVDLGAAQRRANRRASARAPLRRALALADECGALRLAEAAHAELAATGIRVPRRDRSGPEALTPSERRICAMAATGRSNPEIAQALFVTVKTVEMHLGHAYRKLDIRARGELAAALRDAPG